MTKQLKVIQLSRFDNNKPSYYPKQNSDNYFVTAWSGLLGRRLKKKYPQLDIEVWRAEPTFEQTEERRVYNNLKAIIFPYKYGLFRSLTIEMYKRLLLLQKEYDLILHYHSTHCPMAYLLPLILNKTRIMLHSRGGIPPARDQIKNKLKMKIEKLVFPKIKTLFYINKTTDDYFKRLGLLNTCFAPTGGDFDLFQPGDKIRARKRLGLDPNKIYGVYVGKFYKIKGVDEILRTYKKFSKKYNFSVIFVGGRNNSENDLFDEVTRSGCPYFLHQPWDQMKSFYQAADFYVHPVFSERYLPFDNSWVECLACGKPIVSSVFNVLDFDYSKIGLYIGKKEEIDEKVELMINTYENYKNCRSEAKKYLDANGYCLDRIHKQYKK